MDVSQVTCYVRVARENGLSGAAPVRCLATILDRKLDKTPGIVVIGLDLAHPSLARITNTRPHVTGIVLCDVFCSDWN